MLKRLLIILIALFTVFALASCELPFDLPFGNGTDDTNDDGSADAGDDSTDENLEGLVLISKGDRKSVV